MSRALSLIFVFIIFSSDAHARFYFGGGGRGGSSPYSDERCKPIGMDEKGEALWRCLERKKGKGEKPVMRCHTIQRTHVKMIYCSDGSKIDLSHDKN